jgi:hypothetical protein
MVIEMKFVNGYRTVGTAILDQKDFDSIPTLDRSLDGFDTVSQEVVFQLKMKIGPDWYLLEIFQQDDKVNTGITKIERVESYAADTGPGLDGC